MGIDMENRLRYYSGGKLVSWINNICKLCHRFIKNSRGSKKYCSECAYKTRIKNTANWIKAYPEAHRRANREWMRKYRLTYRG